MKRLYRSRDENMIWGVCGGIAKYFSIDPTIVRLIAVLTLFFGLTCVLAYIVLAIVMPLEPEELAKIQEILKASGEDGVEQFALSFNGQPVYSGTVQCFDHHILSQAVQAGIRGWPSHNTGNHRLQPYLTPDSVPQFLSAHQRILFCPVDEMHKYLPAVVHSNTWIAIAVGGPSIAERIFLWAIDQGHEYLSAIVHCYFAVAIHIAAGFLSYCPVNRDC